MLEFIYSSAGSGLSFQANMQIRKTLMSGRGTGAVREEAEDLGDWVVSGDGFGGFFMWTDDEKFGDSVAVSCGILLPLVEY
jgi:hypothetical protein